MSLKDAELKKHLNKPRDKEQIISDRDGLAAILRKSGSIKFIFRYRYKKKQTSMSIGSYPDLSLKDARKKVFDLREMVEQGIDPKRERDNKVKQNEEALFLEECFERYLNAKKFAEATLEYYTSVVKKIKEANLPPVNRLTKEDYFNYFDSFDKPITARQHLKKFKAALRWCYERELIERPPVLDIRNELIGESPNTGERVLSVSELVSFIKFLPVVSGHINTKFPLLWIALTACRLNESLQLEWKDLSFNDNVWTIPPHKIKTRVPSRRPITPLMRKILEPIPDKTGLVFKSGKGEKVGESTISEMIDRIIVLMEKELGYVERFTAHDFRRSLSTRLSELDVMPHVTEKMLTHKLEGVFAVYNKHDWLKDQAQAYDTWAELIKLREDYVLLQLVS